ncbi:hypothetical protein KAFR_0D02000 [Kazachstania africana CBS 2517]|uniref:Amino acid transporter transmembrane domain-containing protein n=1 Tax=Kazachstania africana (strain ATCC 22294 / BCRC 22015 / CBS 2517 / CECT 1963 / NBRC 1671 / NRRL Y-8276) TaxID=1071382 RepID=H2ATZ7_KAZAF|nr:hypothetical protein KAFR_0D02000 [Kazachstania africana CBS 2517]CCF57847.1 hypothetical protein KAFR_0D02000 [Kazachstania africana CBS 2517]
MSANTWKTGEDSENDLQPNGANNSKKKYIRIPKHRDCSFLPSSSNTRKLSPSKSSMIIPSSSTNLDSHVFIDIKSPSFKSHIREEEGIINSLRNDFLNERFTTKPNSYDSNLSAHTSSSYVTSVPSEKSNLSVVGGDITRDIYKLAQSNEEKGLRKVKSFEDLASISSRAPNDTSASSINVPGGFRREFIVKKMRNSNQNSRRNSNKRQESNVSSFTSSVESDGDNLIDKVPFLTRNFLEFLYLYGHFAGESFEDDFFDEDDNYNESLTFEEERSPLVTGLTLPDSVTRANVETIKGTTSTRKAFLLLLKSFVGTGVLFLPDAFHNGGLAFSIIVLTLVGLYSYWCYYILVQTKVKVKACSFGDIGSQLYGKWMKSVILVAIFVSQLGFSAAYMIFTAKNLGAFLQNIFHLKDFNLGYIMIIQLIFFVPLSFIRNISKLSLPSLIANVFIMLGLLIILIFASKHLFLDLGVHPAAGVEYGIDPRRWTLFVGTAIFSFEGIGLIIPVQDSMKRPEKFSLVLKLVMITTTIIFITIATVGYLAYGSEIQTVVLLNLPQGNLFVNLIQFLYSLAIMLSTPLQLFPAIKILEGKVFYRYNKKVSRQLSGEANESTKGGSYSGKSNMKIKWLKNLLRSTIVVGAILIAYLGMDSLDKVVSIIGSFCCLPLVFILPPLLHMKSCMDSSRDDNKHTILVDRVLIACGIVAMFYTSYQSLFT